MLEEYTLRRPFVAAGSDYAHAGVVLAFSSCAAPRDRLEEGCRLSARKYSMAQMATCFSEGSALSLPGGGEIRPCNRPE